MPTKENLCDLYNNQMKTMQQIGDYYGVSVKTVRKWFKKFGIESRGYVCKRKIPCKSELIHAYETTHKGIKVLAEYYGVGERTIYRWFREYGIKPIRSVERKYYHLRKIPFTRKQKEFIIGSLLGDGHIDNGKTKRFVVNHCKKQLPYLHYKKQVLNNFVNKIRQNVQQNSRNSVTYNLTTICHHELNYLHKLFYDNTKKVIKKNISNMLSAYAMAIWYMDDGHTRKYDMKLSTEGFTKEENYRLQNAIYVNFNISSKVCEYNNRNKKYYYLSFNKKNGIKLTKLIKPYVIDCMKYKLLQFSTTDMPSSSKEDDDTV